MLKNALLYLPGTLLPRMASFVVLIAATHLLDKDQVGVLSLIILIGEVSEGISLNWLRIAFVRKLGRVSSVPRKTIIEAAKIASPAVGVAAAFSTVFIFSTKIENVEGFILAVFSYILSNSLLKFGLIFLQVAGRKKTYSILESTRSAAVVLGALTVMNLTNNAYLVSVTMTAITSSFGCIALLLTWRNAPDIENVIKRADILPLAAPLITLAIFNFSITSLDRFALGIFQSTAIVGVYAAGYSIARQGFDVLASAINTSGFPDLVT